LAQDNKLIARVEGDCFDYINEINVGSVNLPFYNQGSKLSLISSKNGWYLVFNSSGMIDWDAVNTSDGFFLLSLKAIALIQVA
jgi:hypothetical protein